MPKLNPLSSTLYILFEKANVHVHTLFLSIGGKTRGMWENNQNLKALRV